MNPPVAALFKSTDPFELTCVLPILNLPGATVEFFEVKGRPVPMDRPRIISRGGKAWAFTPKESKNWKESVLWQVAAQRPKELRPPFMVIMKFVCDPNIAADDDFPVAPRHGDLDNLAKSVLDALFGRSKVFADDRFITDMVLYKRLPEVGEDAGVKIWVVKRSDS